MKTADGGANWISKPYPDAEGLLYSVKFTDNSRAWIAGTGTVHRTTNGGINWETLLTGEQSSFKDIYFVDANIGWIVGFDGYILKSINAGVDWTMQETNLFSWLESIYFIDTNNGWVVGQNGEILHTTDGGANWNPQAGGTDSDWFLSVHFIKSN